MSLKEYDKNYNELDNIRHLMNYNTRTAVNEGRDNSVKPILEYHQRGADGNVYGIVRENNKFYIKVAPRKDTKVLAEDYGFIGGYMNKKEYEYPSYALASKQFGLKMKSLNEAYSKSEPVEVTVKTRRTPSEWQVNETREMRNELNRFHQLSYNMGYILAEDKNEYAKNHRTGSPKVSGRGGNPFSLDPMSTDRVNGMGEHSGNHRKADGTYSERATYKTDFDAVTSKGARGFSDPYDDTANDRDINGVAVTAARGKAGKHSDGKRGTLKESRGMRRTFKLSEDQVLAWSKDRDYIDRRHGTEIGDTAPYDEDVDTIYETIYNSDERVDEEIVDTDEVMGFADDDDELDYYDDERDGLIMEMELDEFGKHPAYRKSPFSTPENSEVGRWGRDWNDKSAKGSAPYGSRIGHGGDPYAEAVIEKATDSVMDMLKKKI